jgi:ActR/RegA family two-component response regulator
MAPAAESTDSILIVDDEPSVRRTFQEWLEEAQLECRILTAEDAESALACANQQPIDLAILDWNLGAGNDGLRLLEDLALFNPEIVAIMVTGYAHQATPLHAMRMGVRDYFDKNQDLNRESFVAAVRRQLDRIRPAKRERRLHQSLLAFRESVSQVVPLVQTTSALTDPVPLPDAIRALMRFLMRITDASDGVLLTRSYDERRDPPEECRAYDASGIRLEEPLVPFARSVAGGAVSLQQPASTTNLDRQGSSPGVELQGFERGRRSLLAVPIPVAPGLHVVFELFNKQHADGRPDPAGFTRDDENMVKSGAELGSELMRQALAEGRSRQVLVDAVAAALKASETVTEALQGTAEERLERAVPGAVIERLRRGLGAAGGSENTDDIIRLAEAMRLLALRHGPPAVEACVRLVEELRQLLDTVTASV